jgi:glycosyltransferase involved in cell wall biosynthesis
MPRFSIIIPCFNAANTILDTLDSLRAQTCTSWEVICIDDGSTDLTRELILDVRKQDKRIKLAPNVAKGPSVARNLAAKAYARGEILAFCDADDIWTNSKLAELEIAFAEPTVDAAYGKIAFFKDQPAQATVFSSVPEGDLTIPMLLGENPVCTMSNIAVRTDVFLASGGFDQDIVHNEDLEWLIRLVGGGARVVAIDLCQVYYRASQQGLSSDLKSMQLSRDVALKSALFYGFKPTPSANAIYQRYLARRALRLGQARGDALKFVIKGIRTSPAGFFSSPKRGTLTLIGAITSVVLPMGISQLVFSR